MQRNGTRQDKTLDWDVPQGFQLPSVDLYSGWQRWLQGIALTTRVGNGDNAKTIDIPVKPLRLLKDGNLPTTVRRSYDTNWKPIMELLEKEVEKEVRNRSVDEMDYEFFRGTYDKALKGVTEKYPVFATAKKTWRVSTYVRKMREANKLTREAAMVV